MSPVPSSSDYKLRDFWKVREQIRDGDCLAYRNSRLIAIAGRNAHSHIAMAKWWDDDLMNMEFRELKGARAVTLASQVARFPGRIDVYRPHGISIAKRQAASVAMRRMCGHDYSYAGLWGAACLHLPGIRWFVKPTKELTPLKGAWPQVCSQGYFNAYRMQGSLLVRELSDKLVEPADIVRSDLLRYEFTLEFFGHKLTAEAHPAEIEHGE